MDRNGLIGTETGLPWRLSADLKRFRKLTTGHPIIMGRKTLEHIGGPLKERVNIVMTRATEALPILNGCVVAHTLDEALRIARDAAVDMKTGEIFIIGGAEVFRQGMGRSDRIYLTVVKGEFNGNTWFPFDDSLRFSVVQDESIAADAKNAHAHRFVVADRADRGVTIREMLVG